MVLVAYKQRVVVGVFADAVHLTAGRGRKLQAVRAVHYQVTLDRHGVVDGCGAVDAGAAVQDHALIEVGVTKEDMRLGSAADVGAEADAVHHVVAVARFVCLAEADVLRVLLQAHRHAARAFVSEHIAGGDAAVLGPPVEEAEAAASELALVVSVFGRCRTGQHRVGRVDGAVLAHLEVGAIDDQRVAVEGDRASRYRHG